MIEVDLLIVNAAEVVTCAGGGQPKRGAAMRDAGIIRNGAVAVRGGQIVAVGSSDTIKAQYTATHVIDAAGKSVCPGFVDPHTHAVYAGDRVAEFELRIQGATYLEIMAAGGGIVSTMQATRSASLETLVAEARARLDTMMQLGTTTVEMKSGYGLDTETELKMLEAIAELARTHPADIVPTFLGAHAVPPEYKGRADAYVELVVNEMIPAAARWYAESHFAAAQTPFYVDVFCEQNTFDVAQSRRVLEAGQQYGMAVKAHVDEFNSLGGVSLALELGAASVDHLDVTGEAEIEALAASSTAAVIMPMVNFHLGSAHFADARRMIDAGAVVALATDINPGSAPCPSMPIVMATSCRYQRLLPAEAMNASTINAAYAIGMTERVGSIEAGKQADLLILKTPDYRHLAYQIGGNLVETVIKKGRMLSWN